MNGVANDWQHITSMATRSTLFTSTRRVLPARYVTANAKKLNGMMYGYDVHEFLPEFAAYLYGLKPSTACAYRNCV